MTNIRAGGPCSVCHGTWGCRGQRGGAANVVGSRNGYHYIAEEFDGGCAEGGGTQGGAARGGPG